MGGGDETYGVQGEMWRCGGDGCGVLASKMVSNLIQDTLKSSTLSCILLVSCIV